MIGLLVRPLTLRKRFYFLGSLCIHQTDVPLKLEGIRALGGFVAMSGSFVVCWDGHYFTRLWCVLEVAVFKACHGNSRPVLLLPLQLAVAIIGLQSFFVVGYLGYAALFPVVARFGISSFYLVAFAATTFVAFGAAIAGHDFAHLTKQLKGQLATFDANTAQCFSPDDRAEIFAKITMLHSSLAEFNEMVRNELRGEVLEGLGEQRAVLPYHFVMIGIAPTVVFSTLECHGHGSAKRR